jgi:cyanophycin synthetase
MTTPAPSLPSREADIQLLRIRFLRGPNIWTYRSALEVWLDLGELEDFPSNRLPGLTERLVELLPALVEHHCGVGERGGFLQRLVEGTWTGHILEHVVIELLNLAGMPTGFGQTRSTSQRGVYRMVFRARDEQVARTALACGHRLLMAAIHGEPFAVPAAVAEIRAKVDDCYLGPSTACIVAAAADRGIPHIRLNGGNLVQLGHGAQQRRIWTAETDRTSAIAEGIASDKDLTKTLLASCGVPVPEGQIVDSAAAAWEAAQDIGLPVVVKPTDGNHARGVSLDLMEQSDVEKAYAVADAEGSEVMVERYIRGDEHRLLVVGDKVVAAARGASLSIVGDGHQSVAALIDSQLNSDPRRGDAEEFPLETIDLAKDGVMQLLLERQGLDAAAVPAAGRRVLVQRTGNVSIDCTDDVHPEVAHAATLAARVVGLDIAGVDLVAEDIGKPLQAQGGAIVEVNAGPGLLMHLKPAEGAPRPVGQAIVDHLFDDDASGRIPIVGVAGTEGTGTIARLVAWLLHLSGRRVGLACRDGLFLDSRRVDSTDCASWESGHRLLINRAIQAAVLENGPASILRDGLAYDRCQVGIVTDMGGASTLADYDIQESDQLARVLRTQVDVVLPDGVAVLNASDARVAALASLCDGQVILYAKDGNLPAIQAHRANGGRAVLLQQGQLVLAQGSSVTALTGIHHLRAHPGKGTRDDRSLCCVLAGVAAAWALQISPDLISAGLKTFETDPASTTRSAKTLAAR